MSLERLHEHRRLWLAKPVLARVYEPWFAALVDAVPRGARVLETGAGPGFLKEAARARRPDLRWVASDLYPLSWNDLAADAGRLPLAAGSVDAVVGLDVLHHLATPAAFFREAARVLTSTGRIALVEPWITPLSWVVYRFFHQEECRLSVDPWDPFPGPGKDSFDGDAAVPWRMVRATPPERWRALGFLPPRVVRRNAFGYLLSLGFRPASLLPAPLAGPMAGLDRLTRLVSPFTALRAELAWPKAPGADAADPGAPRR
ncbi:MAG TPA: class I SAM-dependent methyltransferase [Vicinamibacteria bacterium]|nr:class I SAM-dependent methyltransferase [Vicinamibacteria bacterium]